MKLTDGNTGVGSEEVLGALQSDGPSSSVGFMQLSPKDRQALQAHTAFRHEEHMSRCLQESYVPKIFNQIAPLVEGPNDEHWG